MRRTTKRKPTARQLIQKFPRLRLNENCLTDIACPECGNRDQFRIEMKSMFTLRDDGTDGYEDTEWGRSNYCQCGHCHHEGKVRDFTFVGLDDPRMNPKADAENVQFRKGGDSRYRLVHEGTLEGSSKLSIVVRLVEEELGLRLTREGYFGHGGHSSQTLRSHRPINARVFGWKLRRLMRLPLKELAAIVRTRELLGPKAGEHGFETFHEQTDVFTLKTWCCDYYAANGIDCPESLASLERHLVFRWRRVPIDFLLHNLKGSFQTPLKVEVYRQLIENAVTLPPLICLRRGWDLLEGYHRLAAHREAASSEVACIVVGRG